MADTHIGARGWVVHYFPLEPLNRSGPSVQDTIGTRERQQMLNSSPESDQSLMEIGICVKKIWTVVQDQRQ